MKKLVVIAMLTPTMSGCFIATTLQGSGNVASVGSDHINCSTGQSGDCRQQYTAAGSETLKATPAQGHTFSAWTNCPFASIETCRTSWTQELAGRADTWPITAIFKEKQPPVQAAQYSYNAYSYGLYDAS